MWYNGENAERDRKMEDKYIFRKAAPREVTAVFDLIMSRVAWMDRVGIQQWNMTKYDECYPLAYYEMRRQKDELFVLEEASTGKLACVGALFHEDERWPDKEAAYYLHHLAADLDFKGAGSIFLQLAERYAADQGMQYLRLDSAVDNPVLENYYTSRGYREAGRCIDGLYEGILRQKKLF